MKKVIASILFGVMCLFGSLATSEASEYVNGYEVIVAEDGCVIYTAESFSRFVSDHRGQNITDKIFIATKQHIVHSAIRG